MAEPSDAIGAALGLLPVWVRFGSLGFAVFTAATAAWLAGAMAAWLALRRARGAESADWPERARLTWSARHAVAVSVAMLPWVCAVVTVPFCGPFSAVGSAGVAAAAGVVALLVGLCWSRFVAQRLRRAPIPLRRALRAGSAAFLLLLPAYVPVSVALLFAPERLDGRALGLVALVALGVLAASLGLGFRVARQLGLVRPAGTRLTTAVARAAGRVGVQPRAVYEMDWPTANAMALPLCSAIAFSRQALDCLSDDGIAAVAAHELGHLREGRRTRILRVARAQMLVPLALLPTLISVYGWIALPIAFVPLIAVARVYARWSRRWEASADAVGQGAVDAATFARALETIHRVELLPVVSARGALHPDLYDRLLAAGVTPAYPRPARPDGRGSHAPIYASLAAALFVLVAVPVGLHRYANADWDDPLRLQVALVLDQRLSDVSLAQLARLRALQGQRAAAARLYRGAAQLPLPVWTAAAYEATALAVEGRCGAAEMLLTHAQQQLVERYGPDAFDPAMRIAAESIERCALGPPLRTAALRRPIGRRAARSAGQPA